MPTPRQLNNYALLCERLLKKITEKANDKAIQDDDIPEKIKALESGITQDIAIYPVFLDENTTVSYDLFDVVNIQDLARSVISPGKVTIHPILKTKIDLNELIILSRAHIDERVEMINGFLNNTHKIDAEKKPIEIKPEIPSKDKQGSLPAHTTEASNVSMNENRYTVESFMELIQRHNDMPIIASYKPKIAQLCELMTSLLNSDNFYQLLDDSYINDPRMNVFKFYFENRNTLFVSNPEKRIIESFLGGLTDEQQTLLQGINEILETQKSPKKINLNQPVLLKSPEPAPTPHAPRDDKEKKASKGAPSINFDPTPGEPQTKPASVDYVAPILDYQAQRRMPPKKTPGSQITATSAGDMLEQFKKDKNLFSNFNPHDFNALLKNEKPTPDAKHKLQRDLLEALKVKAEYLKRYINCTNEGLAKITDEMHSLLSLKDQISLFQPKAKLGIFKNNSSEPKDSIQVILDGISNSVNQKIRDSHVFLANFNLMKLKFIDVECLTNINKHLDFILRFQLPEIKNGIIGFLPKSVNGEVDFAKARTVDFNTTDIKLFEMLNTIHKTKTTFLSNQQKNALASLKEALEGCHQLIGLVQYRGLSLDKVYEIAESGADYSPRPGLGS